MYDLIRWIDQMPSGLRPRDLREWGVYLMGLLADHPVELDEFSEFLARLPAAKQPQDWQEWLARYQEDLVTGRRI